MRAEAQGASVIIRTRCRVIDAVSEPDGMVLTVQPRAGRTFQLLEIVCETIAAHLFVNFLRGGELTFVLRDFLFHAIERFER